MWNAITHAGAAGAALLGIIVTNTLAGKLLCLSLITTFIFSVLYHTSINPSVKRSFRMLDMASIHLTIGVTGSAWCWMVGSEWWWLCLTPALFGFIFTVINFGTVRLEKWQVPLCVLSTLLCIILFSLSNPTGIQTLLMLGGIGFYFGGMFFYIMDYKHVWYHTIWHCFVFVASLIHIWAFL